MQQVGRSFQQMKLPDGAWNAVIFVSLGSTPMLEVMTEPIQPTITATLKRETKIALPSGAPAMADGEQTAFHLVATVAPVRLLVYVRLEELEALKRQQPDLFAPEPPST